MNLYAFGAAHYLEGRWLASISQSQKMHILMPLKYNHELFSSM